MNGETTFSTWEEAVAWLRAQPDKQQLVRDAFYDDPLEEAAQRYHRSEEWQEISRWLAGRHGTALDVGAGRGIASYALGREGFVVSALEPDPSPLVGAAAIRHLAARSGLPITTVETFSEQLPFAEASFDVVFARAVLHHTSDLAGACREMFRVLKPGGIFIAAREHVISRRSDLPQFLAQHPLHHLYGGENAFLLDEYEAALRSAGYRELRVLAPLESPINLFPYTRATLREEIARKIAARFGFEAPIERLLRSDAAFNLLLKVAGVFDRRPGRLYSFIGYKQ